ncbi:hypothetical protein KP509_17G031000 [Ceratopteris richardii]|uniref:Secreted protein n=1 Tax=Ceratopteris richardii TaxID=49495 RepID=A0A8T2STV8_CERRI|nr:hypothetical protein KP509_17G031000 [Ceratopteris richardii]
MYSHVTMILCFMLYVSLLQDLLFGTTHSVMEMVKALEVLTYHMESSYLSRMEVISSREILFRSCTSLVAYLWSIRLIHLVDILWSTWRSRMVDTTWRLWIPRR